MGETPSCCLRFPFRYLPILIGFLDQQIQSPHNATIEKLVSKMKGIRKNIAQTKSVIFNSIKLEILALLRPMSNILQKIDLLLPEFLTTSQMTCTILAECVHCLMTRAKMR